MDPTNSPTAAQGIRAPQQHRSRVALAKVLDAAAAILAENGADEFTIAAVAARSGTSVGAVYRRFAGKEQLLHAVKDRICSEIETEVGAALVATHEQNLTGVVSAFVHGLAATFAPRTKVVRSLLMPDDEVAGKRGSDTVATLDRLFIDAIQPHLAAVAQTDRGAAVEICSRTVLAACIHRTATIDTLPDGLTWSTWADHLTDMVLSYLLGTVHRASSDTARR